MKVDHIRHSLNTGIHVEADIMFKMKYIDEWIYNWNKISILKDLFNVIYVHPTIGEKEIYNSFDELKADIVFSMLNDIDNIKEERSVWFTRKKIRSFINEYCFNFKIIIISEK